MIFKGRLLGEEPKTSVESVAVDWFTREQVLEMVEFPATLDRIKDILDYQGKVRLKVYQSKPASNFTGCWARLGGM